jgi:RNA polymerase sigma-54 factor
MAGSRLHQGLAARAEQQLLLQPRMLQSIEVLQVPAQDLEAWLQRAAEENQALVVERPDAGEPGPRPSAEATRRHDEWLHSQPGREGGLAEALDAQLTLLDLPDPRRSWLDLLVAALDADGLLTTTDEELLALGEAAGLEPDPTELGCAIAALQQLEPRGVGGRDLVECLLLQLDPGDPDYAALCGLVEGHLEDIAHGRLPAIGRALGVDPAELDRLVERLRHLDPRPGRGEAADLAPVLRPDVVIEPGEDGALEVRLARGSQPTVSIDPELHALARSRDLPADARGWARECVERARWVVEAVEQRGATLLRVACAVAAHQRAFLERGPGHLVPLAMGDVAAELGLHVSTVSRAVSGKHVQCAQGVLPLRRLFQQAMAGEGGGAARDDLVDLVRAIFAAEDPREPLSDEAVTEELARRGHEVARRTVAKYRRQLDIPSSYRRRRHA